MAKQNALVSKNNIMKTIMNMNKKTMFIGLSLLSIAISLLLLNGMMNVGARALTDSYSTAYEAEKQSTYDFFYDQFFKVAEEKYHVSNRINVYIENLTEEQKLEVLKVSDIEYIINNRGDTEGNIVSWLEVPGEGVFVVDLKAADFIVDNDRSHVHVRAPYPELTNVKIDYKNVNQLLFEDDMFNGSFKQGEDLARAQLKEADTLIKKAFLSNPHFYSSAQKAAEKTIINLVRELNPRVEGLVVEVEFY